MMPVLIAIAGRRGEEFAITQHPASVTGQVGDPVLTLSVGYVPVEAAVQWQWSNPTEQEVQQWFDISGATADSYTMHDTGSGLVLAQNDDRYRANVTFDSETITSNEAIITVSLGDVQEMTGKAKDLITPPANHYYNGSKPSGWNKTMESLPENKTFPNGQKMFICAFDCAESYIQRVANAGFSVVGPFQSTYPKIKGKLDSVAAADVEVIGYIRDVGGGEPRWDAWVDNGEQVTLDAADGEMNGYLSDPNVGESASGGMRIYSWAHCLDDGAISISQSHTARFKRYNDHINAYQGKNLPYGGYGWTHSYDAYWSGFMPANTVMSCQDYMHGASCSKGTYYADYDSLHYYAHNAKFKARIDLEYPNTPNSAPRVIPVMPIFAYHTSEIPYVNNNSDYEIQEFRHNIILSLMMGANGFTMYLANRNLYCSHNIAYVDRCWDGLMDFFTALTNEEGEKALLWGLGAERWVYDSPYDSSDFHTSPITETVIAGAALFRTRYPHDDLSNGMPDVWNKVRHDQKMLNVRDIQYKDSRFIFATNSFPIPEIVDYYTSDIPPLTNDGKITARFSGFPVDGTAEQLKVTDILTGTVYPIQSGRVDVIMNPTSEIVLKVTAADGWIYPQ